MGCSVNAAILASLLVHAIAIAPRESIDRLRNATDKADQYVSATDWAWHAGAKNSSSEAIDTTAHDKAADEVANYRNHLHKSAEKGAERLAASDSTSQKEKLKKLNEGHEASLKTAEHLGSSDWAWGGSSAPPPSTKTSDIQVAKRLAETKVHQSLRKA